MARRKQKAVKSFSEEEANGTSVEVDDSTESTMVENSNTASLAQSNGGHAETIEETVGANHTSADYYFDSYGHFGIHEEMLKDSVRTRTYQNVIYQNAFLFKDKVVLDVGAGTGILSLFCAKTGAKHIYAVDSLIHLIASLLRTVAYGWLTCFQVECSLMADTAIEIVKANGYSNGGLLYNGSRFFVLKLLYLFSVITILKGKIEEIELPIAKVDVIISEWMGYFLLFENMVNSVLHARDKWLVPGGVILPDRTSLYLTAIEDADYKQEKIDYWNNVYGFDMSCIKKQAMLEPLVDTVDPNQIVTNCTMLKTMDIEKMHSRDVSFSAPFKLVANRNDYIHALVAYFDVSFTKCHKPIGFSTGPKARQTHWKQTVMYLEDVITICEGESLTGTMSVSPNVKNPRDIDIKLTYNFNGKRSSGMISRTQMYRMR